MATHYKRRQVLRWLGAMTGTTTAVVVTASCTKNSNQIAATSAVDLSDVTLRVAKYKGGWDLQLKLAGLDNFPYKTQFTEFTGGNLMVQAINANAIDLASCSEIPPIFAIASQDAVKIIAATKGPTIGQTVLVPKNSTAKTIADLKGKKVGYIKATTAHYFLIKMLKEVGLTLKDVNGIALSIPDGLSAFRKGELDAWATYGYSIPQAKKDGARELKSAKDILSGNFLIVAAPKAIADTAKQAAIADFLCRIKKSQAWQASNLETWAKNYATAIGIDESIVLEQAKLEQQQRPSQVLPTSDDAIASEQEVADTFAEAGVIPSKVEVKPLWDNSFNNAISQCSI
ncbi:ABC transporter substrate-binding protein [Nostoc sp. UHCC 0302]|uniref:ABC transporter substrate-binding protein n=1 Tax=Nostoc sp. UHCC 0302 TaxID=3134896 RepID=UPI00311C9CB5